MLFWCACSTNWSDPSRSWRLKFKLRLVISHFTFLLTLMHDLFANYYNLIITTHIRPVDSLCQLYLLLKNKQRQETRHLRDTLEKCDLCKSGNYAYYGSLINYSFVNLIVYYALYITFQFPRSRARRFLRPASTRPVALTRPTGSSALHAPGVTWATDAPAHRASPAPIDPASTVTCS